jgi:hypothetical protein
MDIDGHPWLWAVAKPSLPILIAIPCAAFLIIHHKRYRHDGHIVACLTAALIASYLYISVFNRQPAAIYQMPCNKGHITIVRNRNKLVLIDPGVIGQRISAPSWVEFTLIPSLIKEYGATSIDTIILLQPGDCLFQAITTLATKIKIECVYLVWWQGPLTKHGWSSFFNMKRTLAAKDVALRRIGNYPISLATTGENPISITPLKKTIRQQDITYSAIEVAISEGEKTHIVRSQKSRPSHKRTLPTQE